MSASLRLAALLGSTLLTAAPVVAQTTNNAPQAATRPTDGPQARPWMGPCARRRRPHRTGAEGR